MGREYGVCWLISWIFIGEKNRNVYLLKVV